MSTREEFEKWRQQRLTMDGYPTYSAEDAWKAAWEMSRAAALEEAASVVERYDLGRCEATEVVDEIRALAKDKGEAT